jgi:hypothetical protein
MSVSPVLAQVAQWICSGVSFLAGQGTQNSQMPVCGYCLGELAPLDRWWFHCDECFQRTHWQCGGSCPGCRCCNGQRCPFPLLGLRFQIELWVQRHPKRRAVDIDFWWAPLYVPLASWDALGSRAQSGIAAPALDMEISGPWRRSGREYCLNCIREHVCDLPDDGVAAL